MNNFKNIKQLMNFDNEGDFYFIQIIKRRKDDGNEDMKKGEDLSQVKGRQMEE